MICPKCGKTYDDGTVFCGECGSYIGETKNDSLGDTLGKTMAIPTIKDYERVYASNDAPSPKRETPPTQKKSVKPAETAPRKQAASAPQRAKTDVPREKNTNQKNVFIFIIAFLVVVVIALATILGFVAINSMNSENTEGEELSTSQDITNNEQKKSQDTKDEEAPDKDKEKDKDKEENSMEAESDENSSADFEFAYGLTPGNADRSYTTLTNGDFNYKCALPSDFKFKNDFGDRLRYVAKDKSAYIDIGAMKNSNKLSADEVLANTKSDIGGVNLYDTLGEDWFALNMEKDGICYYQMCYVDEYIRYFEMAFPKEYTDAYELYVEEISDSFVRTE